MSGIDGRSENPKPGIDGTTTSNASSALPPCDAGSVSSGISASISANVPGQPVRRRRSRRSSMAAWPKSISNAVIATLFPTIERMSSLAAVDRRAWRALFAAQLGWMLDAMDFLLFTFAIIPIQKEFGLSSATMGGLTSVALIAGAAGGILFGRLADAIGRVRAMPSSILLYSSA